MALVFQGDRNGQRLIFEKTLPTLSLRFVYEFEGPDQYSFRMERSHGSGGWQHVVAGDFERLRA